MLKPIAIVMILFAMPFSAIAASEPQSGTQVVLSSRNIDSNAIEFRVVWTAGNDLLPEEVDAIKAGSSPLILNNEAAWADVDPNVSIGPGWVTRQGKNGSAQLLVSNRPEQILLPDGSWSVKNISLNTYAGNRKPDLGLEFDSKGSSDISDLTSRNLDRPLAIVVHGRVVSAAVVRAAIKDEAVITGNFTVSQLTRLMNSMMIATPVKIEAKIVIAPSAAMEKLLKQVGAGADQVNPATGSQSMVGPAQLQDDAAESLLAALKSEPQARIIASPTMLTPAGQSAAIAVNNEVDGAAEEMVLKTTPYLQKKGTWVRLNIDLTLSRVKADDVKDVSSIATTLSVPTGKLSLLQLGGSGESGTYLLVKATPQK